MESLFSICMTIPLSAVMRCTRTSDTSSSSVRASLMQGSHTQHSTAKSDSQAYVHPGALPFRFGVLGVLRLPHPISD